MNCRVAFDDFHDFSRTRRMLDRQLYRPPDTTLELPPPWRYRPVLPSVGRFKLFIDDEASNKNRSYKTLGNNVERWEDGWDYRFGEKQACLSKLKSAV